MTTRKYLVHISGVGLALVLTFYATSCDPLSFPVISKIVQQNFNPACTVLSYDVQIPEMPEGANHSPLPLTSSIVASGVSLSSVSPSFSPEIPEEY